jgi:hypothetical protein
MSAIYHVDTKHSTGVSTMPKPLITKSDAVYRDAYLELEEKIRDLKCMASIASNLICELRVERKGDNRTIVEVTEDELNRLVFSVNVASRMADALDDAYHNLAQAQPDQEDAHV